MQHTGYMNNFLCIPFKIRCLLGAGILVLAVSSACGGGGEDALGPFSDQGGAPPQSATSRPDEVPLLMGPVSPDGLQAILGTPDLSVGENRVAFVLTSTDDLVRAPEVTVSSFFFQNEDAEGEPKQMAGAVFRPWPYGIRGIHTTRLAFHAPGRWGIEITVLGEDGSRKEVQLYFSVSDAPLAVAVGSPAVKSHTKTLDDVEGFSELTTGSLHDPDLYRTTVADSVTNGLPTVLVVASPAFCTNAVCGPQVEVLQELKNKYKGRANFIHVDFYDNPGEIQGDLNLARLSPIVAEWGLPSTEWSFVVDREGMVTARFEAFATLDELEEALKQVL